MMSVRTRVLVPIAVAIALMLSMLGAWNAQGDTTLPEPTSTAVATTSPSGPVATTDKSGSSTEQVTQADRKVQPQAYEAQLTGFSPACERVEFGLTGTMPVDHPVIVDDRGVDTYDLYSVNVTHASAYGVPNTYKLYDLVNANSSGQGGTLVFRSSVPVKVAKCGPTASPTVTPTATPQIDKAWTTCKTPGKPSDGWYVDVTFTMSDVDARRSWLVLEEAAGGIVFLNLAQTNFPTLLSNDPGTVWVLEVAQDPTRPDEALLQEQSGTLVRTCVTPTSSPSVSPTKTPTVTASPTKSPTASPSVSPTKSPTASASATATSTATSTVTVTASPTKPPTASASPTTTKPPTTTSAPTKLPTTTRPPLPPTAAPGDEDVYTTPGYHNVNGRNWYTTCEKYSQTTRCRTQIWATTVTYVKGKYVQKNAWTFNNLTYLPAKRELWKGNRLAFTNSWTAADGRKWRTECDTAVTGHNGCRSYANADVIERVNGKFRSVNKEVFNNIVRFSG